MAYTRTMDSLHNSLTITLTAITLTLCLPAVGATVYRSVNEQGVTEFSDSPPPGDTAVEAVEIQVATPQPDSLQQQRLEEMRKTTDKMAADRMAREKHRAELRQFQREAALWSAPPPQPEPETQYIGRSFYSGGYRRQPNWYGQVGYKKLWHNKYWYLKAGHRPQHPIARPPMRPPPHNGYRPPGAGHHRSTKQSTVTFGRPRR